LAAEKENVSIVRKLVAVEANASFHGTFYLGYTALELTVSIQDSDITIASVEAGAEVNTSRGTYGKTTIETAAEVGILEIVAFLLEAGADMGDNKTGITEGIYRARNNGYMNLKIFRGCRTKVIFQGLMITQDSRRSHATSVIRTRAPREHTLLSFPLFPLPLNPRTWHRADTKHQKACFMSSPGSGLLVRGQK